MTFTWPNFRSTFPEMKLNGSSPKKHCTPVKRPCKVFRCVIWKLEFARSSVYQNRKFHTTLVHIPVPIHHHPNAKTLPSLRMVNSSNNIEGSSSEYSGLFCNDTAFSHYLPIFYSFDK